MAHTIAIVGALAAGLLLPAGLAHGQNRSDRDRSGAVQTDKLVRTFKVGPDGSVRITNLAGDIVVSSGGSDVLIEAVKYGKGRSDADARSQLEYVYIDMQQTGSRIDVSTTHRRGGRAWVDYAVKVPAGTMLELRSVSGSIKVNDVKGEVRAESVSGDVVGAQLPRVVSFKTVSGDVNLTAAGSDGDVTLSSVNGDVVAHNLKSRRATVATVSGDVELRGCTCGAAAVESVSGDVDFGGTLEKGGRYAFKSHSGDIRLATADGYYVEASTFSGNVRSETNLVARDDHERRYGPGRVVRGTVGAGGAYVEIKTFSGDVLLTKGH